MRILAIDTALKACSVTVFDSARDSVLARENIAMERGHAEALMPMVARVMDQAESEFSQIDRIAVTVGPGSFTGLRVGIAAARGIALVIGRPAVGVSTLAAFAAPSITDDRADTVISAIDARHEHVYLQMFGTRGRSLIAATYVELAAVMRAVGVTAHEVHLAGSAAHLIAERWPEGRPPPVIRRSGDAPDVTWVARLGAAANADNAPAKPLYLRPPDARPQDAARLPRR
jgi:tRNA threonylcarbamoyl adenosine modification protein YeaZ